MFNDTFKPTLAITAVVLSLIVGCSKSEKSDDDKNTSVAKSGSNAGPANDVKAEPIALKDFPKPEDTKVTVTAPTHAQS